MSEQIEKLYETIFNATNKANNVSDANMVSLIAPLVKAAHESKNEQTGEQIAELIQQEGDKLVDKVHRARTENEAEFVKFQRRFNIRAVLHNYYECEQTDMSFRKLFNHIKPQMTNINFSQDCLKQWLGRLGFSVLSLPYNREIVIEMHSQKLARIKYIRNIQQLREQKQNIVYFREMGIKINQNPSAAEENEVTVFFAATTAGLLNFAFVEKSANTTENFIEWITIISGNQPKNSALVIEPKPFSLPPKPSIFNSSAIPSSFKYERIWNNYNTFIPKAPDNTETVTSIEMLDFCWRSRDMGILPKKSFLNPAKTMEDAGYKLVYLPCLHTELSPMHRIDFTALLDEIEESQRNMKTVKAAIRNRLDSSTVQEWHQYFEDVVRVENDLMRFEALLTDEDEIVDMDDGSDDVEIVGAHNSVVISDEDDD